ncbi:MAG: metal-dependent hydrolase, partial [Pseudomonadales bacterium]|nr:metal-dependent hydrolase [Pseudomonadales bacterium]
MDPLSQGALGASVPQSFADRQHLRVACLLGFLGGMAPDLDILIQSPVDPLLFLEFHRQFTHALIFIPFGGMICGAILYAAFAKRFLSLKQSLLYCTLGYATHGLLDACTTYGTQLFWPFSDVRIAWNNVSVVDPTFTLPVLILMIIGVVARRSLYTKIGLGWAVFYLLLGVVQNERAEALGRDIASDRGHDPVRLEAKPGFANLLVWKIVYEFDGRYYVDAVRVGMETTAFPGESIEKLDLDRHFPWLNPNSQQARDVERFRWFSNDYLAVDQERENFIVDVRYSILPNEIDALWGITLSPDA